MDAVRYHVERFDDSDVELWWTNDDYVSRALARSGGPGSYSRWCPEYGKFEAIVVKYKDKQEEKQMNEYEVQVRDSGEIRIMKNGEQIATWGEDDLENAIKDAENLAAKDRAAEAIKLREDSKWVTVHTTG